MTQNFAVSPNATGKGIILESKLTSQDPKQAQTLNGTIRAWYQSLPICLVIMPKLRPEMTQNAIAMVIQEYASTQ